MEKSKQDAEKTSPGWDVEKRGKQIRIIGGVSRAETVRWYSQALALIHPIRDFREPFGLAPVECQACGTPVIAWNRGAMRETITVGEHEYGVCTGWFVTSEKVLTDTIKMLASSENGGKSIVESMKSGCISWSKRFSVEIMVKRYDELCREAVETGGW